MPPEATVALRREAAEGLSPAWRDALIRLAAAWFALIAMFWSDWQAMAGQWWNSSTYNHILLIPAIIAWLAWQRWPELRQIVPQACRWGLLPFGLGLLVWVLGSFAGLDLFRQAGAVALMPSAALLLLGPRVAAALLFPLCYFGFLVPFGDELVPPLQTITAKITIALVGLSGVPAQIDGVFIDTPAGLFEVAEACSGVKFLIAMIALGALVANLGFRSGKRRLAFMALCATVPILANGIRAWGTIFAAQYVGVEKAAGIDHLIYGWVFFALVMAAVLGVSWKFFDRDRDEPAVDLDRIKSNRLVQRLDRAKISTNTALFTSAGLVGAALLWSAQAMALSVPLAARIDLAPVPGWQRVDFAPAAPWEPLAAGADHRLLGSYSDDRGNRVDVFYALYADQHEDKEAGGFGQGALVPDGTWSWSRSIAAPHGGKGEVLVHLGRTERIAHTWYRSGRLLSGSNARLKVANIFDRLILRARPTSVLILSSEAVEGRDPAAALAAFEHSLGDPGPWMDRVAEGR